MRDLHNNLDFKQLFPPKAAVTDNTAQTSNIIDVRDCWMVELALILGTLSDADATFAVVLNESDDAAMAGANAVADEDLIGTEALMGFTFADDNLCKKLGYKGKKAYLQMVVTPTGNSGNLFMAGIALLGKRTTPTANPPT